MNVVKRIKNALGVAGNFLSRSSRNPNNENKTLLERMYDGKYVTNRSYREYRKMLQDPQVKVGYQVLNNFLLSRKLRVTSASDNPRDTEARDFIEEVLSDTLTPMRNIRKDMYTAVAYGFSAHEVVFKVREDGRIGIEDFYPIHRKTLDHDEAFEFDSRGNLVGVRQMISWTVQPIIPIDKIFLFSYDQEFNAPWGNSILEEIYDTVFIKRQVLKWLAVYLQKHESPTLVGKVGDSQYKDEMREQMEEVSEGRTNLTVGADDTIEVLESGHRGEGFFNAIRYHDDVIFRRFFIGTLLFGQASGGGAYAQSQTQFDVAKILMDGIHLDMAQPLQVKSDYLCRLNFPPDVRPPIIEFEPFEDKDITRLLEILKPYVDNMTIDPEVEWFRELIAQVVEELSGVKVDKENIISNEEGGSQSGLDLNPLPGAENSPLVEELNNLFP